MKAAEIRNHWNVQGKYPPEMMSDFALIEIAAQLAELNEKLAELTSYYFVANGLRVKP